LVHTDYRLGNILVRNSKIVGIIDFEVAHGGSADSDFSLISTEVWSRYKGTKESFLEGYETVRKLPDIEKALPFYEFYTAFTRVGWCVRRNKTDEPVYHEYSNQIDKIIGTRIQ
jgi:aminoglycoside phosphotransferase (APT) family kinase protein